MPAATERPDGDAIPSRGTSRTIRHTRDIGMKKLALKLDELQVESFSTAEIARGEGTVRGHDWETDTTAAPSAAGDAGCSAYYTCLNGCGGSNPNSGWYTCGDGTACQNETEWVNCTYDYKHCGW
jgi:hypothetical protein